jgi:hypothetical protein
MHVPVAEAMLTSRMVARKAPKIDTRLKAERLAGAQVKSKPATAKPKLEPAKTISAPARSTDGIRQGAYRGPVERYGPRTARTHAAFTGC